MGHQLCAVVCGADRGSEVLRSPDPLTCTAVGPQSKGLPRPSLHPKPAHSGLDNIAVKEGRDFPRNRISAWVREAHLSGVPRLRCAHAHTHTHAHTHAHTSPARGDAGWGVREGTLVQEPQGTRGSGEKSSVCWNVKPVAIMMGINPPAPPTRPIRASELHTVPPWSLGSQDTGSRTTGRGGAAAGGEAEMGPRVDSAEQGPRGPGGLSERRPPSLVLLWVTHSSRW